MFSNCYEQLVLKSYHSSNIFKSDICPEPASVKSGLVFPYTIPYEKKIMDFKLDNVQIEKCCRICLTEKDDVQQFQVMDPVINMIETLCELEIHILDGLPSAICEFCKKEIKKFYVFRKEIIDNDCKLKKAFEKQKQLQEILDDYYSDIEGVSTPKPEPNIKKSYICDICHKEVKTIYSLRRHLKIHTGVKPHVCNVCGKSFAESGNLVKHINNHNQYKRLQCNECGKKFYERTKLTIHMRRHTGEKPYSCTVCSKAFATSSQVQVHMKKHTKEKPYQCTVCQKSFPYSGSLVTHMKIHTGTKLFCNCGKSFTQKVHLDNHIRTKHTDERPFMCSECGQRFSTKEQLKTHNRHHRGDIRQKEHHCKSCSKAFMTARELRIHLRTHTNERPYQCDFCGTKFKTSSHMNSHRRIHTGQKNHICSFCHKAFRESSSLKVHLRIHTGVRPYTCSVCKMSFTQSNTRNTHMRTHRTGDSNTQDQNKQ